MLEAIRRAISFLRHKQILHKLGVAVSITVIGIACYVLYHMLRGIDVDEVVKAIKQTQSHQIALAALFVAAGYFTLTFYDLFAVRAIGRADIPYRINALAAFTSYSIGHNVGTSVFTGGAVRYRIYSGWGLNAIDVAKICFLAGLTFSALGLIMTVLAPSYDFFMYYFTLFITPMTLLSGVFFPLSQLPAPLQVAAQFLPLTHAVSLVRPLLAGDMPPNALLHVGFLVVITIIAFAVALKLARRRLLKYEVRRAEKLRKYIDDN